MKEDTTNSLVGFAVMSFIGGFFFPPLFAVSVLLLLVPAFHKGEFTKHARRINDEKRLRLVSSHLMRPIQIQLDCAQSSIDIGEQLTDPELAKIFDGINIKLPPDRSSVDPPLDINKHLSELASLLPTNAGLASLLAQSQKECASELRRVRTRLQASPALFQAFRSLKMFSARTTLDAFKLFSSLGEPAKNTSHSLAQEIEQLEALLKTGLLPPLIPDVAVGKTACTTAPVVRFKPIKSQRNGIFLPSQASAPPAQLRTTAAQEFMRRFNPKCFYHFTDTRNLPLIHSAGGLLSLKELRRRGITPPAPGASAGSQLSDSRSGMDAYVHLCFLDRNPMEWVARREGRIQHSLFLEVDCSILDIDGILLTSGFSNKSGIVPVTLQSALDEFDFDILYQRPEQGNSGHAVRHDLAWRYELLVPDCVPLNLIKNLADDDIPF